MLLQPLLLPLDGSDVILSRARACLNASINVAGIALSNFKQLFFGSCKSPATKIYRAELFNILVAPSSIYLIVVLSLSAMARGGFNKGIYALRLKIARCARLFPLI